MISCCSERAASFSTAPTMWPPWQPPSRAQSATLTPMSSPFGVVGTTQGVSSDNSPISITVLAGPLTVSNTFAANDIDAGSGTVLLSAHGSGQILTIDSGAHVRGMGGVTLQADAVTLSGAVLATGATVSLTPFTSGRLISVGGPDTASALGVDAAELNAVTANEIHIGGPASGDLAVVGAVAPANAAILSLETGGSITQSAGATVTANGLVLTAASGIAS